MNWDLIGGHPAPGSPDAVRRAADAMTRVADLAAESQQVLSSSAGRLDPSVWKGTAADAFRADLGELPERLSQVQTSHQQAATALRQYGDTLEILRFEAEAVLRGAEQADADRRSARTRLEAAGNELDALRVRKRAADLRLVALQGQRAATLDPAQRAAMQQPIGVAQSLVNRLSAEVQAAEDTVGRHQRAVQDAEERLRRAVRRAGEISEEMTRTVDAAVRALARAESDARLPGYWERHWVDAKPWITENGPKIIKILDIAQTVFSVAALVFPPGAAVFTGLALAVGGASFLMSVAVVASSREGFTNKNVLDLGIKFLAVAAGATAFGSAQKLAGATRLATAGQSAAANQAIAAAGRLETAGTWIGRASDAGEYVQAYAEKGWDGVARQAGEAVVGKVFDETVGKVATVVAGKAVRDTIAGANRNPWMEQRLSSISGSLATGHPSGSIVGVPLGDLPNVRPTQSLLGTGHIPPGGFLPGHGGGTSILDHAVGSKPLTEFSEKVGDELIDPFMGQLKGEVTDAVLGEEPEEPELEIDLPMTGGNR